MNTIHNEKLRQFFLKMRQFFCAQDPVFHGAKVLIFD
jgi:hypothetical protein